MANQRRNESDSDDIVSENATKQEGGHSRKSSSESQSSDDQSKQEAIPIVFGNVETAAVIARHPDGTPCCIPAKDRICSQFLLQLNSPAIRAFFKDKDIYSHAATEANCSIELSKCLVNLTDKEWPKYHVIQITGTSSEALDEFTEKLEELNPAFAERLPYDFDKYRIVESPARTNSVDQSSSQSERTDSETDTESAGGTGSSGKEKSEMKKIPKKRQSV